MSLWLTVNRDEPFVDIWDQKPEYSEKGGYFFIDHRKPHTGTCIGIIDIEDAPAELSLETSPMEVKFVNCK